MTIKRFLLALILVFAPVAVNAQFYIAPSIQLNMWTGTGGSIGAGYSAGNGLRFTGGAGLSWNAWYPNAGELNSYSLYYFETDYLFHKRNVSPYLGMRMEAERMFDKQLKTGEEYHVPTANSFTALPILGLEYRSISLWLGFGMTYHYEVSYHNWVEVSATNPGHLGSGARHQDKTVWKTFAPSLEIGLTWYLKLF